MFDALTRSRPKSALAPTESLFSAGSTNEARRAKAWLTSRIQRGRKEKFAEFARLDPALAELLIEINDPQNRAQRYSNVDRLVTDIKAGHFMENGETIVIASNGIMIQGQHRAQAVKSAGMPVPVLFAFGIPYEARTTMDQGIARTAGDYMAMDGKKDAFNLAATAKLIWQYQRFGRLYGGGQGYQPTKQESREFERAHPQIAASLAKITNSKVATKSFLAFCHYVFWHVDRAAADDFIEKLMEGSDLPGKRNPILRLRERLLGERRMRIDERAELAFRAWNFYRRGMHIASIAIHGNLPKPE